ncbi:hypothetical protein BDZ89DRAFT_1129530 [Hymenopellis radicata]|nr:hypothetical protein BDZ89DRAFT_1129530 [Hymenopellis radicata]
MALTTTSLCCRLRRDRRLVLSRCRDVGFGILAVLPDVTRNGAAALATSTHPFKTLITDSLPSSSTTYRRRPPRRHRDSAGRRCWSCPSLDTVKPSPTSRPHILTVGLWFYFGSSSSHRPPHQPLAFVDVESSSPPLLVIVDDSTIIIRCLVLINIDSAVHCRLTVSRKVFSYRYVVKFPSFAMSLIVHTIVKDLARSRRRLFELDAYETRVAVNDNLDGLNTHDSTGLLRGGAGEGTIDAATSVSAFDYFTR